MTEQTSFETCQQQHPGNLVCAVVVTRNRLKLLKECVSSLKAQTRGVDEIIIVDNDSDDGTKEWLSEQSGIRDIHQKNTGSSGGFAHGIEKAVLLGYQWVWCMDDDCVCREDALASLLDALPLLPSPIGFLCSRPVNARGETVNAPVIDQRATKQGIVFWDTHAHLGIIRARQASFVSVMVSRHAITECGLPLAEYFIWGDDAEYTSRIATSLPSFYVPASTVQHKRPDQAGVLSLPNETSTQRISMFHYYYRNCLHYRLKNYGAKECLMFAVKICRDIGRILTTRELRTSKLAAVIKGVCEFPFFRPKVRFVSSPMNGHTESNNTQASSLLSLF